MAERIGVQITGNKKKASDMLSSGPVITSFGSMYALLCLPNSEQIETMAIIKGRPKEKPFVMTTYQQNAGALLTERMGISKNIPYRVLTKVTRFLNGSPDGNNLNQPLGVLLPATDDAEITQRLLGKQIISVNGMSINTIGFMVPGKDSVYEDLAKMVDGGVLVGTSANPSGIERARGSGNHRIAGVMKDFGNPVKVLLPRKWREENGPSTTTVFVSQRGEAFLVREGSLPRESVMSLLEKSEIPLVGDIDGGARKIKPYDYSQFKGGEGMMWIWHKYALAATSNGRTFIAPAL